LIVAPVLIPIAIDGDSNGENFLESSQFS